MIKEFHQPMDNRIVVVEIQKEDNVINFSFKRAQWFYDIPISEWNKDYPYWQDHMNDKRWFTPEMASFITANTK